MISADGLMLAQATATRLDQRQMLEQMRLRFSEADPDVWWKAPLVLGLLLVALVLVWVLSRLQRRRAHEQVTPQPRRLFMTVMIHLGLPWWDIYRLWRLARKLKIEHPAVLLISAGAYDDAVQRAGVTTGRAAPAFQLLRNRLFDPRLFPPTLVVPAA